LLVRPRSGRLDLEALRAFVEGLPFARPAPGAPGGHHRAYVLAAGVRAAGGVAPRFEFGPESAAVYVEWSDNPYGHAARAIDWVLSRYECEGFDFDYGERYEDNDRCRDWLRAWHLDEVGHTPERAAGVLASALGDAFVAAACREVGAWRLRFGAGDGAAVDLCFDDEALDLASSGGARPGPRATGLGRDDAAAVLLCGLVGEAFGVRAACSPAGDVRLAFGPGAEHSLALAAPAGVADGDSFWELVADPDGPSPRTLLSGDARSGVRVLTGR
jgi:hypothetical protein